jgi:uncharacterized protein (UPF0332 family)
MLDKKKTEEIKRNVERLINEGKIIKDKEGKFPEFFAKNSRNSFDSARLLFEVSTNKALQKSSGFSDFDGFLWVINSSYYSMFYMTRALLESRGVKIKTDLSVHSIVLEALIYYFYLTGKIEKNIIEEFKEAGEESGEILGKEKAKELIEDYTSEKDKRSKFTYEMGAIAMENKAKTSLERAKRFNEEIRKLI